MRLQEALLLSRLLWRSRSSTTCCIGYRPSTQATASLSTQLALSDTRTPAIGFYSDKNTQTGETWMETGTCVSRVPLVQAKQYSRLQSYKTCST
ncbi:hypothetical protein V8F06_009082 [Rhypophila decipiens]